MFVIIYALSSRIIVPAFLATVRSRHNELDVERSCEDIRKSSCRDDGAGRSTTESLRNIELVKSWVSRIRKVVRLNATTEKILKLELKKVKYIAA